MKNYLNPEKSKFNRYSIGHHCLDFIVRVEFFILLFTCIILIFLSKSQSSFTNKTSDIIFNISNPIVNTISYPFKAGFYLIMEFKDLAEAKKENIELRKQNNELKKIILESSFIKNENQELKEILNFVLPKSTNIATLKIIGKAYGMFNHNFTVKKDPEQNLISGDVAIFKKSVIGRVTKSNENTARIMLLTDSKSRIPIISEVSRNRGILTGKNSSIMEIKYLSKQHTITEGELIFTSSDGDQIPPGILAGVVTKVRGSRVYVKMAEDINNIDQLTIIQY